MTRKRIGTGLLESFSHECEACKGRGVVITAEPVEPRKDEPRSGGATRSRRGGRNRSGSGGNGGNAGKQDKPAVEAESQGATLDTADAPDLPKDEPTS
jgi:ribonuclease E